MESLRSTWSTVTDVARTAATDYTVAVVAGAAVLVLLVVGWLAFRAYRRRGRSGANTPPRPNRVRRHLYLDEELLRDLGSYERERLEATSGSASSNGHADRSGAHDDEPHQGETHDGETDGAPAFAGLPADLQGPLAGVKAHGLLVDLDRHPDADLREAHVVVATGRLQQLPATTAAELLQLSAPLLQRAASNGSATIAERPEVDEGQAPVVVAIQHAHSDRQLLMTLDRSALRDFDGSPVEEVTLVGVVERVLDSRDTLSLDDYLAPHLTDTSRRAIGDRSVTDVVIKLSEITGEDVPSGRDLAFQGPGAQVSAASLVH